MKHDFKQHKITEKIVILSKIIGHMAEKKVLEKEGVSMSGYEIMHILGKFGQVCPSDLCACLASGKSNISQRLAFLEKRGLVRRISDDSSSDGRRQIFSLTDEGVVLLEKLDVSLQRQVDELEVAIGKEEVERINSFLDKAFSVLIMEHNKFFPMKKITNTVKKVVASILLLTASLSLTGCAEKKTAEAERPAIAVKAQTIADSHQVNQAVEYPAIVYPEEEALVVAKAAGTASGVKFKLGDKVRVGDQLVKIDDASKSKSSGKYSFNTGQVKQAQLGVEQAYASLVIARTNYQSLVNTADKDLRQAEIAKEQAAKGLNNVGSVSEENYKAAELAYDSAKLAAEQAKINLDASRKQAGLSSDDASDNSSLSADTVANTCNTIIVGLDNALGLDSDGFSDVPYSGSLGALDSATVTRAKDAYRLAKKENDSYQIASFADESSRIKAAISLATKTKSLADAAKSMLEKTVSSNSLPQSSLTGVSLDTLMSAATGYQSQAAAALSQANGTKQNLSLLQKAYELAKKQEESALQNLNSLKAGNASQKDQAGFASQSAGVQYDSAKVRINSQLAVVKSQLDMSEIQYRNALVSLQELYDSRLAIAPISGVITKKEVDNGSTVSQGQTLFSISKTDKVKIQFFADERSLEYLSVGQDVEISDNNGNKVPGKIYNLTPQADAMTKRFLVEVRQDNATSSVKFISGTVVNVSVVLKKVAQDEKNIILPITALEITQNGNFVFLIENGKAKKTKVDIVKIDGETAEVKIDASPETSLIVGGNKLVRDGEAVNDK